LDLAAPRRLERPRVALLAEGMGAMLWNGIDVDARASLAGVAEQLDAAGAEVVPVVMPPALLHAHAVHATIYERALAYYFSVESEQPENLSVSFRGMLERGHAVSLHEYTAALDHQESLRRGFDAWVADFDAVITLSTVGSAPAWGADDPDDSALIWTLCGAPTISVPVLRCANGMPLGLQVVGRRWHDHALLDVVDWLAERGLAPRAPVVEPAEALVLD
jgi:Asp-tRNA(Asn)/Glu-tRNA(Gln) amidotransferase A subunit family amidase